MGQLTFRGRLLTALGAALFILVCIAILSYRRILQEDADQRWVEHTHLVLEKIASVSSGLVEQENAQRGYTITKDDSFLQSYGARLGDLPKNLADLRDLTSDNPKQQAALDRLDPLIASRLALFKAHRKETVSQDKQEIDGRQLMDEIRAVFLQMRQEEQTLLSKRLEAAESSSRRSKFIIAGGYALCFLLLALAGLVVQSEITKRRETEQELKNAQERYHLLFDSNPIPVWVYDVKSLAILDVNAAAIRHYGYSREEFHSLTLKDIRPPEDIPALVRSVAKTSLETETAGIWRHRKKDGTLIDVEITSHPLAFGGRDARLVVAADITRRRKAEEALRQSEERFRLIVSSVKDYAILMLDTEGRVISWNEGAERIKGYRAEEIIGQHFSRFYTAEDLNADRPAAKIKEAMENGRVEDEGWRVRKDGSRFWANVVITALRDESGLLRGFGKVTRDISERKRAEQEILQRSVELEAANKELEAFSYSVSHDLRSPLRAIDGFSQAILEDHAAKLDDDAKNYFQRIRAATQRMGELIDDLLGLSRVTRAEIHRERIDLSSLAEEVAADLRSSQPEREVEFRIVQGLQAEGDSRLIRVALQNLIGNSWKFTSKRPNAQIEFGLVRSNGQRAYFVRDNGAGFDQAYADRLFGAFQRLHGMNEFPGTGIGLATVQRIVHRHGGKVWAEGVVDKGATVYFTL
jgi:PAS domain S-box-containing protein